MRYRLNIMVPTYAHVVSHGFFDNPHRVYLISFRTPLALYRLIIYSRRYWSATPVVIVFASGHLSIYNDCNKIFRTYIKMVNRMLLVHCLLPNIC